MALGCAQCPPTRMLSAPTMTAQRQERNGSGWGIHFRPGIALITMLASLLPASLLLVSLLLVSLLLVSLLLVSLGEPGASLFAAHAATTERVVANRYSGMAIEGYDPVAYFVDGRPMLGVPEFEAAQAGVAWRFRNEGNRAS